MKLNRIGIISDSSLSLSHQLPQANLAPIRYKRIKDYVYDMQCELGRGNFSEVYLGRKEGTGQEYAVKVIKLASLTFKKLEELLDQQVSIIQSLNHPNILRCQQVLRSVNHCYIVAQLCEQTLHSRLGRFGPMDEDEGRGIIEQFYQGLRYLSDLKIIHRDIKPANVFVNHGVVKIADFGFAVRASESFKDFHIGSPLYMSPEGFLRSQYSCKTDVWAFGVVVYEILHGRTPLGQCNNDQEIKKGLLKPIKDEDFRNDLSWDIKDLIKSCLQIDPNRRPSFQDLQKFSYFQTRISSKSLSQIKPNYPPVRRISVPSLKMDNKSINLITFPQPSSSKENQAKQKLKLPTRIAKRRTKFQEVSAIQVENNQSVLIDCRSRTFLRTQLSFNAALDLIHLCRVGFRTAQENIAKSLKSGIKAIVLRILTEILSLANGGLISYEQADSKQKKEGKLRAVVSQYLKRYEKQMQQECRLIDLQGIVDELSISLKESQKEKIPLKCYLVMTLLQLMKRLKNCIDKDDFKSFAPIERMQKLLQQKQFPPTMQEYTLIKSNFFALK